MKFSHLILVAAGVSLLGSCSKQPAEDTASELPQVRRVVTSENADGKSYILADGPSGNVVELNGSRIERLWESQGFPVPVPVSSDLGATAGNAYREGFAGSSAYVADIPPGSDMQDIPLHRQDSMDYIVLLEGELELVLDDGVTTVLKPGDILVQAGNNHTFVNRSKAPARLLCIIMTGERAALEGQSN